MSCGTYKAIAKAWPPRLPQPPSSEVSPQTPASRIAARRTMMLPEVASNVFMFLDLRSLTNAQQVCKMWRDEILLPAKMKQSLFLEATPITEVLEWTVKYPNGYHHSMPPDYPTTIYCNPKLSSSHILPACDRYVSVSTIVGILHPALEVHPSFDKGYTRFRISMTAIAHNRGKPVENAFLTQPPCKWKDVWMFEIYSDETGYYYRTTYHLSRLGDTFATFGGLNQLRLVQPLPRFPHCYFLIDRFVESHHAAAMR